MPHTLTVRDLEVGQKWTTPIVPKRRGIITEINDGKVIMKASQLHRSEEEGTYKSIGEIRVSFGTLLSDWEPA